MESSSGTFAGSRSMRDNYNQEGVDGYYASSGSSYCNPHFHAIVQATAAIMDEWMGLVRRESTSTSQEDRLCLHVLDLACGSGEATLAIKDWLKYGTRQRKATNQPLPQSRLDMTFHACDPYTYEAYEARNPGLFAERWSFEDIANGVADDRQFHVVISSYALHVTSPSLLFTTLLQLSFICKVLIILSPHKKPEASIIERGGHWRLIKSLAVERVHAWLYESQSLQTHVRDDLNELMAKRREGLGGPSKGHQKLNV